MKNLIIVNTPFQFLSSLEAINRFDLQNNTLVIIDNNQENNTNQLTKLIEEYKFLFNEIIRLEADKKSKFLKYVKLIKNLKKDKFNMVFIGDLGSIQKIMISNIDCKEVFLLDDGGKTILIHKAFEENKELFKKGFRQFRFNLFGLKTTTKKTINIFTLFNLSSIKGLEIIQHNFEYFKKVNHLAEKSIENKVFILGQPLIENGRIQEKAYENYLNKIISLYDDCEIFYLMHRREKKEQLDSYNLQKNLNIIKSSKPGELFFVELAYKPKAIIGVNTTLLFSLKRIFDDLEILSYKIDKKDMIKNFEWFEDAYKYFKQNDIKIIE